MAFTKINDLIGILFLTLLTIPSQATNLDCDGKAFHCVNSTHFMICVDLGRGVSTTIDDFIIPCPTTTVCRPTNRFECEFPVLSAPAPEVSTTDMLSEVTVFNSDATTSIPFEEYFNTVSTTTISQNELQSLATDSILSVESITGLDITNASKSDTKIRDETAMDINVPSGNTTVINPNRSGSTNDSNSINMENNLNLDVIHYETTTANNIHELTTVVNESYAQITDLPIISTTYYSENLTSTDFNIAISIPIETKTTNDIWESSTNASNADYFSSTADSTINEEPALSTTIQTLISRNDETIKDSNLVNMTENSAIQITTPYEVTTSKIIGGVINQDLFTRNDTLDEQISETRIFNKFETTTATSLDTTGAIIVDTQNTTYHKNFHKAATTMASSPGYHYSTALAQESAITSEPSTEAINIVNTSMSETEIIRETTVTPNAVRVDLQMISNNTTKHETNQTFATISNTVTEYETSLINNDLESLKDSRTTLINNFEITTESIINNIQNEMENINYNINNLTENATERFILIKNVASTGNENRTNTTSTDHFTPDFQTSTAIATTGSKKLSKLPTSTAFIPTQHTPTYSTLKIPDAMQVNGNNPDVLSPNVNASSFQTTSQTENSLQSMSMSSQVIKVDSDATESSAIDIVTQINGNTNSFLLSESLFISTAQETERTKTPSHTVITDTANSSHADSLPLLTNDTEETVLLHQDKLIITAKETNTLSPPAVTIEYMDTIPIDFSTTTGTSPIETSINPHFQGEGFPYFTAGNNAGEKISTMNDSHLLVQVTDAPFSQSSESVGSNEMFKTNNETFSSTFPVLNDTSNSRSFFVSPTETKSSKVFNKHTNIFPETTTSYNITDYISIRTGLLFNPTPSAKLENGVVINFKQATGFDNSFNDTVSDDIMPHNIRALVSSSTVNITKEVDVNKTHKEISENLKIINKNETKPSNLDKSNIHDESSLSQSIDAYTDDVRKYNLTSIVSSKSTDKVIPHTYNAIEGAVGNIADNYVTPSTIGKTNTLHTFIETTQDSFTVTDNDDRAGNTFEINNSQLEKQIITTELYNDSFIMQSNIATTQPYSSKKTITSTLFSEAPLKSTETVVERVHYIVENAVNENIENISAVITKTSNLNTDIKPTGNSFIQSDYNNSDGNTGELYKYHPGRPVPPTEFYDKSFMTQSTIASTQPDNDQDNNNLMALSKVHSKSTYTVEEHTQNIFEGSIGITVIPDTSTATNKTINPNNDIKTNKNPFTVHDYDNSFGNTGEINKSQSQKPIPSPELYNDSFILQSTTVIMQPDSLQRSTPSTLLSEAPSKSTETFVDYAHSIVESKIGDNVENVNVATTATVTFKLNTDVKISEKNMSDYNISSGNKDNKLYAFQPEIPVLTTELYDKSFMEQSTIVAPATQPDNGQENNNSTTLSEVSSKPTYIVEEHTQNIFEGEIGITVTHDISTKTTNPSTETKTTENSLTMHDYDHSFDNTGEINKSQSQKPIPTPELYNDSFILQSTTVIMQPDSLERSTASTLLSEVPSKSTETVVDYAHSIIESKIGENLENVDVATTTTVTLNLNTDIKTTENKVFVYNNSSGTTDELYASQPERIVPTIELTEKNFITQSTIAIIQPNNGQENNDSTKLSELLSKSTYTDKEPSYNKIKGAISNIVENIDTSTTKSINTKTTDLNIDIKTIKNSITLTDYNNSSSNTYEPNESQKKRLIPTTKFSNNSLILQSSTASMQPGNVKRYNDTTILSEALSKPKDVTVKRTQNVNESTKNEKIENINAFTTVNKTPNLNTNIKLIENKTFSTSLPVEEKIPTNIPELLNKPDSIIQESVDRSVSKLSMPGSYLKQETIPLKNIVLDASNQKPTNQKPAEAATVSSVRTVNLPLIIMIQNTNAEPSTVSPNSNTEINDVHIDSNMPTESTGIANLEVPPVNSKIVPVTKQPNTSLAYQGYSVSDPSSILSNKQTIDFNINTLTNGKKLEISSVSKHMNLAESPFNAMFDSEQLPQEAIHLNTKSDILPLPSLLTITEDAFAVPTTSEYSLNEEPRGTLTTSTLPSTPPSFQVESATNFMQINIPTSHSDLTETYTISDSGILKNKRQFLAKPIESTSKLPLLEDVTAHIFETHAINKENYNNTSVKGVTDVTLSNEYARQTKAQSVLQNITDTLTEERPSVNIELTTSIKKSNTIKSGNQNELNVLNTTKADTKSIDSSTFDISSSLDKSQMTGRQDPLQEISKKATKSATVHSSNVEHKTPEDTLNVNTTSNIVSSLKIRDTIITIPTSNTALKTEPWRGEANSVEKSKHERSFISPESITPPTVQKLKSTNYIADKENFKIQSSVTSPSLGVATDVIKTTIKINNIMKNEDKHSGLISFITKPTTNSKSKEKKENPSKQEDENDKNEKEIASLTVTDISTSLTIETTSIMNKNIEQTVPSRREKKITVPNNNHLKSTINDTDNIDITLSKTNDTNLVSSIYKKVTTKDEFIKNATAATNRSNTSNIKSKNQNNMTVNTHNITVISKDQNNTAHYSSQAKSAAVGDTHTYGFPVFKSTTSKPQSNKFTCKNKIRGKYADELDCRKFYICIGNSHVIEGTCPVNTVFSEIRKQCTKNLSHCIRNNQFRCVAEGHFIDYLNDNVYYICVKNNVGSFIRFKLQCQNGYHLNKTSVRCVLNKNSEQTTSASKSEISNNNSEQSVSSAKLEEKAKSNKFRCKKEGIFVDPSNCNRYFECRKTDSNVYRQKRKKCDSDEYFHKDKKKCVDAESYECN